MRVIIVRERESADGHAIWEPQARRRYHRRHDKPARLRRLWKTMCALNHQTCVAFECAHQQWVNRP